MFNNFIKAAAEMYEEREPFAIALVVNRNHPSSGKPGDKAVIKKDGSITGWIGGGCTRGIILKEALAAMQDGKARLVKISPDKIENAKPGVMMYNMTCHSGGSVEVFIEPVLPKPSLLIFGRSHIAMALEKMAKSMAYTVNVVLAEEDRDSFPNADRILLHNDFNQEEFKNHFVVVCTQGEGDEISMKQALSVDCSYLSFVSSRKKANAVYNALRSEGVNTEQLMKIKTPAGLDINAKLPEEVAISILAEMIQVYRGVTKGDAEAQDFAPRPAQNHSPQPAEPNKPTHHSTQQKQTNIPTPKGFYINPVCQVPVQMSTAKHVLEHKGEKVYFCCDGCKVTFEKEPERFMVI